MNCRFAILALSAIFAASPALTLGDSETQPSNQVGAIDTSETPEALEDIELLEDLAPAMAVVEYTLRYDDGKAVRENLIIEQRPLEMSAIVLTPTMVVSRDAMIHQRFIESIHVRRGDQRVPAKISAYAVDVPGVFLELDEPLENVQPLEFDASAEGPYKALALQTTDGMWQMRAKTFSLAAAVTVGGGKSYWPNGKELVIDKQGTPVGVIYSTRFADSDSWKGSPLDWPIYSAEQREMMLADLQTKIDNALLPVVLNFRSPRRRETESYYQNSEEPTVMYVLGALVEPDRMVIFANLTPINTARLERITVNAPEGKIDATFKGTLRDYGCFVAKLEKPLPAPLTFASTDMTSLYDKLLLSAEVLVRGEQRITHLLHSRLVGFSMGRARRLNPSFANSEDNMFRFLPTGELLVWPMARRQKVSAQERYHSDIAIDMPCGEVMTAIGDLASNIDPNNAPLDEKEESRLAWLGVELQPMDRELARVNNVAHLTNDGQMGAIVSYIYSDSPADKAGLKMGDIVLRLHVSGEPKPIDIQIDAGRYRGSFPWDRLDEIPEQYYDQIPTPWAPAENFLTRALTDLGFGREFTLEYFRDGELKTAGLNIVKSPEHYNSANRFKADDLGLTVRNLTYEVRRYFQRLADQPGIIISNITPGSKASVAGLKPFEIITHVNNKPVSTTSDFEQALTDHTELNLTVLRMMRGRTVKIRLDAPTGL